MAPGWDERHATMEEAARPVTVRMLERSGARRGETILELAAGTGVVGLSAMQALGGDARLVLSDFSPAMVDVARRRGEELGLDGVEYRVLDAEALDLPDGFADRVLCRWGYMLMADPAAAFAETYRVLRPAGRVAAAVFGAADRNPWAALPVSVLVEAGVVPAPVSGEPGILALADVDRLRALFAGAGFGEPDVDEVAFEWPFPDEEAYWRFLNEAAGAIAPVLAGLGEDARTEVRGALAARLRPFSNGGLRLPAMCLVASADRP
jgi:SAM-dependent methyltransferase